MDFSMVAKLTTGLAEVLCNKICPVLSPPQAVPSDY